MNLQFSILNVRLIDSQFSFNPKFAFPEGKPVSINSKLDIEHKIKGQDVNVILSVSSDNNEQPFVFRISFLGSFKFTQLPDKKTIERIAHTNLASMIFPYIRESIADLTRRASIPPYHLPPVNFVGLYLNSQGEKTSSPRVVSKKISKSKTTSQSIK